jgi:MFS family permease
LIVVLPLVHFFTLDAISFLISAGAVFSLGRRFAWKPAQKENVVRGVEGVLSEITGAIKLVRAHRPLAWAMVTMGLVTLAWAAAFTVGAPLLAARVLRANVGAYGLVVGAYGVGNVLSNLMIGSLTIRRKVAMLFLGKVTIGVGFLIVAFANTLPIALLGSAFAAIGGPMGDIVLLTMIQTDFPSGQIGKVYSLLMFMGNAGMSVGLLLAVPLFAYMSVPVAIALCALVIAVSGTLGLVRFGLREPVVMPPLS